MGHEVWMYHSVYGAKIVNSDDMAGLIKDGWRDSPAKLVKKEEPVAEKTESKPGPGRPKKVV